MPTQHAQDNTHLIRASELGQYAYCPKAWWLGSIEGVQPSNARQLESGAAAHARHGARVAGAEWMWRIALMCLAAGGVLTFIWLVMTLL